MCQECQIKNKSEHIVRLLEKSGKTETPGQLSLFGTSDADYSDVIEVLMGIDISQMTPMSAMNKLYELQEMLKK